MEYPKRWSSLFAYHQEKISQGITSVYDPHDTNRTFGILLLPDEKSKRRIFLTLSELLGKLPEELREKMRLQTEEQIHFSVQWSDKRKVTGSRKEYLLDQIDHLLDQFSLLAGELSFPFVGSAGLYGLMETNQFEEMVKLRNQLRLLFMDNNLKPGIPEEDYDLVYTSLVRYLAPLTNWELQELKNFSVTSFEISLDEVVIAFNDKLMSRDRTDILLRKKF